MLTDGRSGLHLRRRPILNLDLQDLPAIPWHFRYTGYAGISGLTYEGLAYPLKDAGLTLGSTAGSATDRRNSGYSYAWESGILLLIVTPDE